MIVTFKIILCYFLAGSCGFLVGISELISRYKSFRLIFANKYSWVYIGVNSLAALLVLYLIRLYNIRLGPVGEKLAGQSLIAGFGAMAILRSSFFHFKDSNDKVIELGPAAVLAVFLKVAERRFSQNLSRSNVIEATKIMKGLPFAKAARELPIVMLNSHRIFSEEEQKNLSEEILLLVNNPGSSDEIKNIALGTLLERYFSLEFLKVAVDSLRSVYEEDMQKVQEIDKFQDLLNTIRAK